MPNPILYTQAMLAAAMASAMCVLALGWNWGRQRSWLEAPIKPPPGLPRWFIGLCARKGNSRLVQSPINHPRGGGGGLLESLNLASVMGIACGLLAGYRMLHLRVSWPPVSALDRLLTLIIPAVIGVELLAGWNRVPRWLPWCLRVGLALLLPRVLLHGSVYLSDTGAWPAWRSGVLLIVNSVLLALMWWLMLAMARKRAMSGNDSQSEDWGPPAAVSASLSLCLSIQCAAATIMLAGYVTGGAAALPLTAALAGAVLASRLLTKDAEATGIIGIGVVGLFGLLFIGRFFGGLSTVQSLTILLAPLLCWVTETRVTHDWKAWQIGAIRLVLVVIPLIIVVVFEMQDFYRHTLPLLPLRFNYELRITN